jgi:hypothetical protein
MAFVMGRLAKLLLSVGAVIGDSKVIYSAEIGQMDVGSREHVLPLTSDSHELPVPEARPP